MLSKSCQTENLYSDAFPFLKQPFCTEESVGSDEQFDSAEKDLDSKSMATVIPMAGASDSAKSMAEPQAQLPHAIHVENPFLEVEDCSSRIALLRQQPQSKTLPGRTDGLTFCDFQEDADSQTASDEDFIESRSSGNFHNAQTRDGNASPMVSSSTAGAMTRPADQLPHLQYDGPALRVQNTFISVDDVSPSIMLLRKRPFSKTLPPCTIEMEFEDNHDEKIGTRADGNFTLPAQSSHCSDEKSSQVCAQESAPSRAPRAAAAAAAVGVSAVVPQAPSVSQTSSLTWSRCNRGGHYNASWMVDARKVRSNDKQAVSPTLELPIGPGGSTMKLRLALYPKFDDCGYVLNFKSSKGRGYIQVKCESGHLGYPACVRLTFSIGAGRRAQSTRGPVWHDFSENSICGLPKHEENWDFGSAVDKRTMMLPIAVTIFPVTGTI